MHAFVRSFITEWRRLELPTEGETIVVAVSGGADSVSLLLALHDLKEREKIEHRIVAAHLNHHLRGTDSDADEKFVKMLAGQLGVELALGGLEPVRGANLEQNARDKRYGFLSETAERVKAFAVATGHTINDQAETFLMNLLRGSGVDGLAAMPSKRSLDSKSADRGSTLLIRPLLCWAKRGDTEAYCKDLGIEYRYDTMNEDTAFRRVRIRKVLLPLLEDFNPKIVEVLARTANLMQNVPTGASNGNRFAEQDELILSELRTIEPSELSGAIRSWLHARRGNTRGLGLKHITAVERLIFSEKSGRMAEVPGGRVIKRGGRLLYEENKVEK
jgi:tRNA(Ile)-lysidine synthase